MPKWNHQDELQAAIGKKVRIWLAGDNSRCGTLVGADQFTIKLDAPDESESWTVKFLADPAKMPPPPKSAAPDRRGPIVYFKSALIAFEVLA